MGRMRLNGLPQPARRFTTSELLARTDSFNAAADRYFADHGDVDALLEKPWNAGEYGRYLFNLGVLFHWAKVAPGDTVADFGAGTCWVSHFLNLHGCRTISVDVSPAALALGRRLFQQHSLTRWELDPRFVPYDGYTIPLEDGACDRVIVHDAFHHVPNQEQILGELCRITKQGGIVAMCEPGRCHSNTPESRREMETTGVLENDIVVEELERVARSSGFRSVSVVPLSLGGASEVAASDFPGFLVGRGLLRHWSQCARFLVGQHFILLYKGEYRPTSRRQEGLRARIEVGGAMHREAVAGGRVEVPIQVRNEGEALWLGESHGVPGVTRVGAHLGDAEGAPLDHDWYRLSLPGEMAPHEEAALVLELSVPSTPGRYVVEVDLVAEGVAWFGQLGSPTAKLTLDVRAAD